MKIDIVIPTYNRGFLLKKIISNILKQTYKKINIIISDNNSLDNTEEIGRDLERKINNLQYYKNNKNYGVYENYNIAIYNYCTAKYVLILSDDDFFVDRNYIETALKLIKEKNLVWIGAGYFAFSVKDKKLKKFCSNNSFFGNGIEFFKKHKFGFDNFAWFTVIFNREEMVKRKLRFDNKLYNSDFEVIFDLCFYNNKVGILNKPVGIYTIHSAQTDRTNQEFILNGYKLYENLKKKYKDKYPDEIYIKNVKDFLSGTFRFFMDRDVFDNVNFEDEKWFEYIKNLDNGKFYPFFDKETEKLYKIYKKNKQKYKQIREETFKKTWKSIEEWNFDEKIKSRLYEYAKILSNKNK